MARADFVHLHVHSEYSILGGACRVKDLVERAAEFEMPSVSLTDHDSMGGAIQLWIRLSSLGYLEGYTSSRSGTSCPHASKVR